MNIRQPAVAGAFYEASPSSCRHHAEKLLQSARPGVELPARLYGGLVPHAGWVFSGHTAAMTINALASAGGVETFVLFGADHVGVVEAGEVFDSGVWRTPLGEAEVDQELARAILEAGGGSLRANPSAHGLFRDRAGRSRCEHSIEVQVPLIQAACPGAKIVPIAVPPAPLAVQVGQAVGGVLARRAGRATVVGSTDLTHHGEHYGSPGGSGEAGVRYAKANDRRMLDLIEAMRFNDVVAEARQRMNACGAGAIAATMAAAAAQGAARGIVLEYTNCHEILQQLYPGERSDSAVGYAAVVFA